MPCFIHGFRLIFNALKLPFDVPLEGGIPVAAIEKRVQQTLQPAHPRHRVPWPARTETGSGEGLTGDFFKADEAVDCPKRQ
jgi:hypothetical protein